MLEHTCGCGGGVYWRQKTHDITKGKRRSAYRLFFCGQKKIFYCFFLKSYFTSQKGPVTTSAVRRLCTWSERLRPFCSVSPTGGGRASLIGRQRPGQGCDATSRSSPRIYFSGPFPLSRQKNCGRRQRNGGYCKEKPESELELVSGRKRERREVIGERERRRGDWEEGGKRCAPAGRQAVQPLPALGFLGSLKYASYF